MYIIGLNFDVWSNCGGIFFKYSRIRFRGKWTPFVKVRKRYKKWFGFWGKET